jgi:hypothetical protein
VGLDSGAAMALLAPVMAVILVHASCDRERRERRESFRPSLPGQVVFGKFTLWNSLSFAAKAFRQCRLLSRDRPAQEQGDLLGIFAARLRECSERAKHALVQTLLRQHAYFL